jgi:phage-related tail fiber protein
MVTLNDLPAQDEADVSNDDLLLIWETGAGSNNSRKVTRAHLLKDVPRIAGNAEFDELEATELTAGVAALTFASTAALTNLLRAEAGVTVGTLAAGASETQTLTVTGAATTDFLANVCFTAALSDGLTFQAWISATNTISIRFRNNSAGSVSGATYTARAIVMRFA